MKIVNQRQFYKADDMTLNLGKKNISSHPILPKLYMEALGQWTMKLKRNILIKIFLGLPHN